MEIQSALQSGLQGFQGAQQDAAEAAFGIVQATTPENEPSSPPAQSVNLTEEIVNLKVAEFQAKASAEVIQTADETLGTLLDVRA